MKHGTTTAYTKGRCRCDVCREGWREYQRRYMRERYHGQLRTVPAAAARRYLAKLARAGVQQATVSASSGVSKKVLREIRNGQRKSINVATQEKILSVPLSVIVDGKTQRAASALALMEAMGKAGLSLSDIETKLKISQPERIARQQHVRPRTFAKLVVTYKLLARRGLVPASLLDEVCE